MEISPQVAIIPPINKKYKNPPEKRLCFEFKVKEKEFSGCYKVIFDFSTGIKNDPYQWYF